MIGILKRYGDIHHFLLHRPAVAPVHSGLSAECIADFGAITMVFHGVRILVGVFFDLDPLLVGPVVAVYDRAALVALDRPTRARYVEHLFSLLPSDCRGFLITLEFPTAEMEGPPFSVDEVEVRELFGEVAALRLVTETDVHAEEPRLAAQLSRLVEQAFIWSRS